MEYYSAMRKKQILPLGQHGWTLMALRSVKCQIVEDTVITLLCEIFKKSKS